LRNTSKKVHKLRRGDVRREFRKRGTWRDRGIGVRDLGGKGGGGGEKKKGVRGGGEKGVTGEGQGDADGRNRGGGGGRAMKR